ncbi:hypothetical protein PMAYCL1PPCAC_10533, partial [Pristionchus mayeri]
RMCLCFMKSRVVHSDCCVPSLLALNIGRSLALVGIHRCIPLMIGWFLRREVDFCVTNLKHLHSLVLSCLVSGQQIGQVRLQYEETVTFELSYTRETLWIVQRIGNSVM